MYFTVALEKGSLKMDDIIIDRGVGYILAAGISAAATFGAIWLKHYLYEKKQDIVSDHRSHENVYASLQKILKEFGADRVYIYEFHNGEHFFSGQPQKKFSCSYEWTGEGVSSESNRSQNYRVTNFHKYISHMISDGEFFREDTELIKDFSFRALMQEKGVQSIYNIALKSASGKNIGFIGVDYVKSKKNLNDAEKRELRTWGRQVGAYLSN
jgi:hypothetical protein